MIKEKIKSYLKEDGDILEELDKLEFSGSQAEIPRINQELMKLQIKATLRNRKSLENMNESSFRVSLILALVGFLQFVVITLQFLESVTHESIIFQWLLVGFFAITCISIMWSFNKKFKEIDENADIIG